MIKKVCFDKSQCEDCPLKKDQKTSTPTKSTWTRCWSKTTKTQAKPTRRPPPACFLLTVPPEPPVDRKTDENASNFLFKFKNTFTDLFKRINFFGAVRRLPTNHSSDESDLSVIIEFSRTESILNMMSESDFYSSSSSYSTVDPTAKLHWFKILSRMKRLRFRHDSITPPETNTTEDEEVTVDQSHTGENPFSEESLKKVEEIVDTVNVETNAEETPAVKISHCVKFCE